MLVNATQALKRIFDRVYPFLKDDLLRGMVELLLREPAPMRQRPVAAATVNSAMPEEERKKLLTLSPKIVPAASRARARSRTASWAGSGVHTPVSSPAR